MYTLLLPATTEEWIVEACKAMEIVVHDHIIVGFGREKNAFSMRAAGMMGD